MQDDSRVLTAGYVVCMDEEGTVYSPGYVEISSGKIKSVGSLDQAPSGYARTDYGNVALIPGLINSHNHAAMSLMRGVADDLPLDDWLRKHIWPLEWEFVSPEFVHSGTLLSVVEMLKGGTTFFSDMYFLEDQVARASILAGIRVLIGDGALAFPSPSVKDPDRIFDVVRSQYEKFKGDRLVSVHMPAHSTYSTTEDQLKKVRELALELDVPVQIHCAESKQEAEECLEKHSKSQVAYLNDLGLMETRIALVHMVWPQEGDLERINRPNVSVVSCPQSNLKLASGIPPVEKYLDAGIRVSLGTDGAASNNNQDIWEELRLAAFLVKGSTLDPVKLPAKQALRMVTIEAARTWGMGDRLGSIEPGKEADLAVVDLSNPHTTPVYDIYSTLVYAAGASDVRDVYVAGKQVVKDRIVTTVDEEKVVSQAAQWATRIKGFARG